MASRIQRLPSGPDHMSRMQDRGREPSLSSFPQQIIFDGGLLNAVIAEGFAGRSSVVGTSTLGPCTQIVPQ